MHPDGRRWAGWAACNDALQERLRTGRGREPNPESEAGVSRGTVVAGPPCPGPPRQQGGASPGATSTSSSTPGVPPAPLLVDASGLGALLGVSRATVFRLDKADRLLDGTRLGACRRWSVVEVRAWVAAGMPGRFEWRALLRRRGAKEGAKARLR